MGRWVEHLKLNDQSEVRAAIIITTTMTKSHDDADAQLIRTTCQIREVEFDFDDNVKCNADEDPVPQ